MVAAIVVGSRNLQDFDPALVAYTFAIIFATWGVVYHYNVWLRKPPTRIYWERGWQLFGQQGILRGMMRVTALGIRYLLGQGFIRQRSRLRWAMHQLIFWGCILAGLITFPLVFGWISFRTLPNDQMMYVVYVYGFPTLQFGARSIIAELLYHGMDIAAFLVLGGIFLAANARSRSSSRAKLCDGFLSHYPLVRNLGDRTRSDRIPHLAARAVHRNRREPGPLYE